MSERGRRGGLLRSWLGLHQAHGAVVPFEAPALRMGRVCHDEREGLIAVLRDFASNGTAYVVPWGSLPLIVRMNEHDSALHQGVAEARAVTPAQVRAVVSTLALSGALGPERQALEVQQRRSGATQAADVELLLILHLLDACGVAAGMLTGGTGRMAEDDARTGLAAAARSLGLRRQEVYQRISDFAKLLVPVGLAVPMASIHPGWLRVLHGEIQGFGQSCTMQALAGSGAAPALAAIGESATRTACLADVILGMIDCAILRIVPTMRRWMTEQPVLRQAIDRLASVLDEWPVLMASVQQALRGPADAAAGDLATLCAIVPQCPGQQCATHVDVAAVHCALAARMSAVWAAVACPAVSPAVVPAARPRR